MADAAHPTIGEPPTRPSRRTLLGGTLVAILLLALLDGGIAAWGQLTARGQLSAQDLVNYEQYSLSKHVLAMLALAAFTVGIACTLVREKQRILAGLVVLGVAAGPMAVIAAPVTEAVILPTMESTQLWWQVLVQGSQLLILAGWTWWTSSCIRGKRIITVDPMQPDQTHGAIPSALLFSLYAAVTLTAQIMTRTSNGIGSPGLLAMAGWAMLGAGCAVVILQSSWWPMAGVVFAGSVLMLGTLYDAYYRPGGWPGVAGWDLGLQSPIILSFSTSAAVLAGPLIAAVLRRRHPPAGAPVEASDMTLSKHVT